MLRCRRGGVAAAQSDEADLAAAHECGQPGRLEHRVDRPVTAERRHAAAQQHQRRRGRGPLGEQIPSARGWCVRT